MSAPLKGSREPIAIVGIGCRLPGGIDGPGALWDFLSRRGDAIGEIPRDRFDLDRWFDERPRTPGRTSARHGGYLDGIDLFDAGFFGISPKEAERLDPQQRLLLETAWEALEEGGLVPDEATRRHAGVYVGMWIQDFEARLFRDPERVDYYMTTGSGRYAASGRLSYFLGFEGPSLTVDSACSSSLVAVHLACRALWSGEVPLALAGGASVILQPHVSIAYSQSAMLSADGRCKFGDASADGYVRSEGAALVALKRLPDARRDGDRIHATIVGSAVNNDGQSSGFLATPGQAGQEEMLRRAYADAGIDPSTVGYVEAHGTGTRAGDPVELGALGAVLGGGRPADRPCLVGSLKTNVGHTEGAAGVAGLIKAALCLREGRIPASLHLERPNPRIPWDALGVAVPADARDWPAGAARVAGVSSFGISGTNAHVVLAAAPAEAAVRDDRDDREDGDDREATALVDPPQVAVAISARDPRALRELAARWRGRLDSAAGAGEDLADLARASVGRRLPLELRAAAVARDAATLADRLDDAAAGRGAPGVVAARRTADAPRRFVFVFPGQGSQWLGMGRDLLRAAPPFRASLERSRDAIAEFCDWDLLEELAADGDRSRLDEIDVIQPTLFALEIAYADLWRAWGVEPSAVIGHSMGEAAAACVAGALPLRDAARVLCCRSRLLRRVRGQGEMAVVGLPLDEAERAIAGREDRLSVAVSNSPRSTVLSGDPAALDEVLAALAARDVFCRKVKVDVASHSPQMDPLRDDLRAALAGMEQSGPRVAFHSTVRRRRLVAGEFGVDYWVDNLRQPVRFADAVRAEIDSGANTFLEMSPHPILLTPVAEALHALGDEGLALASSRRDEGVATMLESAAALHAAGHPVDWPRVVGRPRRAVALPAYPWQRARHWLAEAGPDAVAGPAGAEGGHPLLDRRVEDVAGTPGLAVAEGAIDRARAAAAVASGESGAPALLPVGAELALLLAGAGTRELTDVRWQAPVELPAAGAAAVQVVARDGRVELFARDADGRWTPRVAARFASGAEGDAEGTGDDPAALERAWRAAVEAAGGGAAPVRPVSIATVRAAGPVELEDVRTAPADGAWAAAAWAERAQGAAWEIDWIPAPPSGAGGGRSRPGAWIVGGGDEALAAACASALESRGARVTRLDADAAPEDAAWSDAELAGALWLDPAAAAPDRDPAELLERGRDWLRAAERSAAAPRVWAATRGACRAGAGDPGGHVAGAAVHGWAAVAALERPALWGGIVDLPPGPGVDAGAARALAACLLDGGAEDRFAIRGFEARVPRLRRATAPAAAAAPFPALDPDAAYVVTGGYGAAGGHAARWLAARGARRVVLVGRTGLPPREQWDTLPAGDPRRAAADNVRALEAAGVEVALERFDVADARATAERLAVHAPVRGVVHAAGTIAEMPLLDTGAAEAAPLLAGKLAGARALDAATAELDLDLFVLYASGSGIWGSIGLAAYAAANRALGALAEDRASRGLPATAIDWGWLAAGGLVDDASAERFARTGLAPMPPELVEAALDRAVAGGAPRVAIADLDPRAFRAAMESRRALPLLADVERGAGAAGAGVGVAGESGDDAEAAGGGELARRLAEALPGQRAEAIETWVREEVARILGHAGPDAVDAGIGFFKLGMDSMMTVQLRLKLERGVGRALPPTIAFEYPTARKLAAHLDALLGEADAEDAKDAAGPATGGDDAGLSEEELEAKLLKKLEEMS